MRLLVSGATGFIGKRLVRRFLELGHQVSILTRSPEKGRETFQNRVQAFSWDANGGPVPSESLAGVDTVVHLAGESVFSRWTDERKQVIYESRVLGTRRLVEAANQSGVSAFISTSAIGYYGDCGDDVVDESGKSGGDFLARVCVDWEKEAKKAQNRVAIIRVGLVMGKDGGALKQMLPIFRLGLGGRVGSGKQWMSWIHVDDLVELFVNAASNKSWQGVFNGVAPTPVRNAEFTQKMGSVLSRPTLLPVPAFALKLVLGEMGALPLMSARVFPRHAQQEGFVFRHPNLKETLQDLTR